MPTKFLSLAVLVSFSVIAASCDVPDDYETKRKNAYKTLPHREDSWFVNPKDRLDPYADLNREDYMGLNNNTGKYYKGPVTPKISMPNVTDLLAGPEDQELISDKLVSISVNENVPLRDVIVELARRAEVDVEVDREITGGIIFIAKDRPFSEVIKRIARMANLRYSFDGGVLRIERDMPVVKNYKFNILDITRSSSSTMETSFSVGGTQSSSGGSSGGSSSSGSSGSSGNQVTGGSISGGSSSNLNAQSGDGNIWSNIEAGITQIVTMYGREHQSASSAGGAAAGQQAQVNSGVISVNRNAGVISVLASGKQHDAIKEYLDRVHIELTSQVLIEARVVEVTLSDEYKSGVQWSLLADSLASTGGLGAGAGFETDITSADFGRVFRPTATSGFNLMALPQRMFGADNSYIDGTIELLQTFGTTRSLSNPRINTLNNQSAVLNFSKNEVYFEIEQNESTTTSAGGTDQDTVLRTTIRTVPIGVVLNLQPSIDLEKNEVMLMLRPTLTRVTDRIVDPGARIIAQNAGVPNLVSEIPVVDTRELDTMLRIKNGEIMVIGGLLEERAENTDSGVPGLSKIPYLGNAFKSVSKTVNNVETVIFIKATIVPGKGVSVEDKEFYKKFTTSRTRFLEE